MKGVETRSLRSSISTDEFLLFRDYMKKNSGIVVPPEKAYLFETRLSKLMVDVGFENFTDFHHYLVSGDDPLMREKIINAMVNNETKWFRDEAPWSVMEKILLPRLVGMLLSGQKKQVRIWCAAVSTGQEVYSTAMCIDNYLSTRRIKGVSLDNFEFFATDISSRVLDIAKKGRYDKISIMRGLNDYYRTKYFTGEGSAWVIDQKIRGSVKFQQFDLQNDFRSFGLFDIVFCRYVLIYFSDDLKRKIIAKIRDALCDDGVFFAGHTALYEWIEGGFISNYYENLTYYIKEAGMK